MSSIQDLLSEAVAEAQRNMQEQIDQTIRELRAPDRSSVAFLNASGDPVARLTDASEPIYQRMRPEVRRWRSPRGDQLTMQYLRGMVDRNHEAMFRAARELEDHFQIRATTTEGIAGASGALSTGTGGSLIPRPLENLVIIARDRLSKMRRVARTIAMTAQTHTVPTGKTATAYMTLEGGTTTQGEPTYASVQITARKCACRMILTREVLDDQAVNAVSVISELAGEAIAKLEEEQFWDTANGTDPNLSAKFAGTAYSETTSGILDFTSVRGMFYALPSYYRQRAAWFVATDVLALLAGVVDTDGKMFYGSLGEAPKTLSDEAAGAQSTLLGLPLYEVDATDGTIHLGDAQALYVIGERQGIQARVSEDVGFATDTIQFLWTERVDGQVLDASAGQTCTGITTANSL